MLLDLSPGAQIWNRHKRITDVCDMVFNFRNNTNNFFLGKEVNITQIPQKPKEVMSQDPRKDGDTVPTE
jgi:hypothetical protein